jgi:hypothetical protein
VDEPTGNADGAVLVMIWITPGIGVRPKKANYPSRHVDHCPDPDGIVSRYHQCR